MKVQNRLRLRSRIRYLLGLPTVCLRLKSGQKMNLSLKAFDFVADDDDGLTIHWAGSFYKPQLVWVDLKQVEAVEIL